MAFNHDFFAAQRYHKRISLIFYGLFLLAVGVHALLLLVVCVIISYAFTHDQALSYWLTCLIGFGLYIAFGLVVGRYRVRLGGVGLAKKMGAVRLFVSQAPQGDSEHVVYHNTFIKVHDASYLPSGYARLYEFVAQMSIASGLPMPMVYVLPNQLGVNAWVAGFDETDTVMVFTQGAVDKLDNEALYGLIGHEFGHILHGDGRLNLRIYVLMTALSWFYECAEWLEEFFLGGFDRHYHGDTISDLPSTPYTKEQWIHYWQRLPNEKHTQKDVMESLRVQVFLPILLLMGVVVLLRMAGLLGMATHEWIVHRFNRERELLADATSIQLTRSFGVLDLLMVIEKGADTSLVGQYSTHMGYFFFVNPNAKATFFDTHPSIDERILAINGRWYDGISRQFTADLDKHVLQKAHDDVCQHADIMPLAAELSYDEVVFYAPKDDVVDGRLVVDQAWYDWSTVDDKPLVAPSKIHSTQVATLSDEVLDMTYLKGVNTPWQIVKYQRQAVGVLAVIEVLLLCRYDEIDDGRAVDFFEIYAQHGYNENSTQSILEHTLDAKLIAAVAALNRRADGLMIVQCVKILRQHLTNPYLPIKPRQQTTLQHYYQGLTKLLLLTPKTADWAVNDFGRLLAKIDKYWQACVLALVYDGLSTIVKTDNQIVSQVCQQVLAKFGLDKLVLTDFQQISMLMLAFLAGVQDNSLLVGRMQPVLSLLERCGRLLDIPMDQWTDELLVQLIYQTQQLEVNQWACLLMSLIQKSMTNKKQLHDTLHTALLYDGQLAQKESDILLMLQLLWLDRK